MKSKKLSHRNFLNSGAFVLKEYFHEVNAGIQLRTIKNAGVVIVPSVIYLAHFTGDVIDFKMINGVPVHGELKSVCSRIGIHANGCIVLFDISNSSLVSHYVI